MRERAKDNTANVLQLHVYADSCIKQKQAAVFGDIGVLSRFECICYICEESVLRYLKNKTVVLVLFFFFSLNIYPAFQPCLWRKPVGS